MALTIPTVEPTTIIKGTTARWTRALSDFPADEGWSLSYRFVGPTNVTLSTTATQTTDHYADFAATTFTGSSASACTGRLTPGDYYWQSYAASGTLRYEVGTGETTVVDDFAARVTTGKAYDGRSTAQRIVDAIDAIMSGTATLTESSISVDGRSLSNRPLDELLKVRDRYARIAMQEEKARLVANGQNPQNSVRVRFVSP